MSKRIKFWSIVAALFAVSTVFVYLIGAYIGDESNPMRWTGAGRFFHVFSTLAGWWLAAWVSSMVNDYMDGEA